MAKTAMVKLTKDSDWQEVEVANFYDPEVHNTVRIDGSAKKVKYSKMKMQDGRVFDKDSGKWLKIKPDHSNLVLDSPPELPFNYKDNSVDNITFVRVLERCDNVINLLRECSRVLVPTGRVKSTVPLAPSAYAFSNPEFKNYFNEQTFNYFKEEFSHYTYIISGDTLSITLKK